MQLPEAEINITQSAVTGSCVDPTYMAILSELSELQSEINQDFQKILFLFLNSIKTLLKHRGSALSFVLTTLLQAKYNILNDLPTLATLSPSQLARETGESPEYSVVSAMLAAGHVSLSSFQDKEVVTLQGLVTLRQEMTRINPISGQFNPTVCEQFSITHLRWSSPSPAIRLLQHLPLIRCYQNHHTPHVNQLMHKHHIVKL
jgi:hypothetical protein